MKTLSIILAMGLSGPGAAGEVEIFSRDSDSLDNVSNIITRNCGDNVIVFRYIDTPLNSVVEEVTYGNVHVGTRELSEVNRDLDGRKIGRIHWGGCAHGGNDAPPMEVSLVIFDHNSPGVQYGRSYIIYGNGAMRACDRVCESIQ